MRLPQYINWKLIHRPGKPKPDKVPIDAATGSAIDPHDPAAWMTREAAEATGEPVGFVFTADDPYFLFDLDGVREGDNWSAQALSLVARFPGAMVEVSQSGNGLHVIGSYSGDPPAHKCKNADIHGELYTERRFVALGSDERGDPGADCTDALHTLAAQYFPSRSETVAELTEGPRDDYTGTWADDELLAKALSTRKMFEDVGFADLWNANEAVLAKRYPSNTGDAFDRSSADLALANHLAFWTGQDGARMLRLMRRSSLNRDKWDERCGYLENTVTAACDSGSAVYSHTVTPPPEPATLADVRTGYQLLPVSEQTKLFAGHIYVISQNAVMTPDGRVLKQAAYNVALPSYEFARDDSGKATTRKPWEALTESQAFDCPIADELTFEPDKPFGHVIERAGRRYANTYRPIDTPRRPGDPSKFLTHLEKLLPDDDDREIMLSYMAAVVQHKGVKFQWCPLVQGVQGNGKTLLTEVLFEAVGMRYAHTPQARDLDNTFNSWLRGKIIIGVEDMAPGSDIIEALKPMITNRTIGTTSKGVDQETSRICCNFFFNSNHRDAIAKTQDDRRFAVFFTPQQTAVDLARDGMGGDYFPNLYNWLRREGHAIAHDYLATYEIPAGRNPATDCHRAPDTSSTRAAIEAGRSPLAKRILDMVAEDHRGFRGGWISRSMLSHALGDRVTISRQRSALAELGYMLHPALTPYGDGNRTNKAVVPDERKAELWVSRSNSILCQLDTPSAVANSYEASQGNQANGQRKAN